MTGSKFDRLAIFEKEPAPNYKRGLAVVAGIGLIGFVAVKCGALDAVTGPDDPADQWVLKDVPTENKNRTGFSANLSDNATSPYEGVLIIKYAGGSGIIKQTNKEDHSKENPVFENKAEYITISCRNKKPDTKIDYYEVSDSKSGRAETIGIIPKATVQEFGFCQDGNLQTEYAGELFMVLSGFNRPLAD